MAEVFWKDREMNNARAVKLVVYVFAVVAIPPLFLLFLDGVLSGDYGKCGLACACAVLTAIAVFVVRKVCAERGIECVIKKGLEP